MTSSSRAYRPKPTNALLVWFLRLMVLSLIGAVLLALLLAAALLAWQFALQDRVVPGVSVGDVDLSGMTQPEALAALEAQFAQFGAVTYTLRDGQRSWQASAAELGLRSATPDALENAFDIGHAADGITNLLEQAEAWLAGARMPVQVIFDEGVTSRFLQDLAREIDREGQDASLSIVGTEVQVSTGISERKLDIPASMVRVIASLRALAGPAEIELVINERAPRLWNVAETALHIDAALADPVQLVATDSAGKPLGPWTITPEQIRSLLTVTLTNYGDGKRFDLAIDTAAILEFLESLAPGLLVIPRDSRFEFDAQTGQLIALEPSTSGRELNIAKTIERLETAIFDRYMRVVPMVFDVQLPRYHDQITAAELGIAELVAEATSYYWGSWQNRRANIESGAEKLHGVIIGPGEEFSFNRFLGDITPEAGFVDGAVIFGGSTVTGIGGGICQVSTTVFRAAFSGGFAVTERNSHGYRVGYYEYAGAGPGLDAAIWQPTSDFRFQNNTPYHLLIESEFMGARDALQFRFYSTRHWHTVVEPPIIRDVVGAPPQRFVENRSLQPGQVRQVDYSADGADVWVYRNVYDLGGSLIKRDQAYTHYRPWQAVFEVAPGDPRLVDEEDEGDA